ncbi:autotransporter domain-containing protein [Pantoea sp.]|uniref:autotransporter domain-containing protein n=1 Tax=Pantoea sp. TaxID=69393 RepID=UPI00289EDC83|nr:autotransporter domain-containing protein [Pantoea sp.]
MLQKSECAGQQYLAGALIVAFLFCLGAARPAYGWDNLDRLSDNPDGETAHPRYNDILAGKIARDRLVIEDSESPLIAAALNAGQQRALSLRAESGNVGNQPLGTRFSAGWEMPLSGDFTTGPVAQYAISQQTLNCQQCDFNDRLSHDHIASFGWRVDSRFGPVTPWAQLSYSRQLGDGALTAPNAAESGLAREDSWLDVSVGAQMPINSNMAAFAAFSQTGALSSDEQFIYSLGVSASF